SAGIRTLRSVRTARTAGTATGRRIPMKLLMFAALVVGSVMLMAPVTASADSRVSLNVPCVAYADGGATRYEGSGINVIAANGVGVLSCHLSIVTGTPVAHPTATTYGTCVLLQLPGGQAELRCKYQI